MSGTRCHAREKYRLPAAIVNFSSGPPGCPRPRQRGGEASSSRPRLPGEVCHHATARPRPVAVVATPGLLDFSFESFFWRGFNDVLMCGNLARRAAVAACVDSANSASRRRAEPSRAAWRRAGRAEPAPLHVRGATGIAASRICFAVLFGSARPGRIRIESKHGFPRSGRVRLADAANDAARQPQPAPAWLAAVGGRWFLEEPPFPPQGIDHVRSETKAELGKNEHQYKIL